MPSGACRRRDGVTCISADRPFHEGFRRTLNRWMRIGGARPAPGPMGPAPARIRLTWPVLDQLPVVTNVSVRVLVYGPAVAEAGISKVRSAPRLLVPFPFPIPAEARTAGVVWIPGAAGATVGPSVPPPAGVPVGVHPSWSPEMVAPAAVPLPTKSATCPLSDQPGKVFRVSVTVTGCRLPVAVSPLVVRFTVPGAIVSVIVPVAGTVTAIGSLPVMDPCGATFTLVVPCEPL